MDRWAHGRKLRHVRDARGRLRAIVLEPVRGDAPPTAPAPPAPAQAPTEPWQSPQAPPYAARLADLFPRYAGMSLAEAIAAQERAQPPRKTEPKPPSAPPAPAPPPPSPPAQAPPPPSPSPQSPPLPFLARFAEVFPAYAGRTLEDAIAEEARRPAPQILATAVLPQVAPTDPRPFMGRFAQVFPRYKGMTLEAAIAAQQQRIPVDFAGGVKIAPPPLPPPPARRRVVFEVVKPPAPKPAPPPPPAPPPQAPPSPPPFLSRFHEVFPAYAGMDLDAAIAEQAIRPVFRVELPPDPPAPEPAPIEAAEVGMPPAFEESPEVEAPPAPEEPPALELAPEEPPVETPVAEAPPEPPQPSAPPEPVVHLTPRARDPWDPIVEARRGVTAPPDLEDRVDAALARWGRDVPADLDSRLDRILTDRNGDAPPADLDAKVNRILSRRR